jgi:methyl-accepting chemotaxis protein
MRRLPFAAKISLIGLLATLPVVVVVWSFFVGVEPRSAFLVALVLCMLDVLALLYCLVIFHLSVTRDLDQVVRSIDEIMAGDLRYRQTPSGSDEMHRVALAVNQLGATLSGMVANLRSNAAIVAHAGSSLTRDSQDLSERTTLQAATLQQTAFNVTELSEHVQQNSDVAGSANVLARKVRDAAESGTQVMTEAVASVVAVQASSKRMDEIVGVIDGLAFQTNILALNAAVESARAGEAGRGFAVVASEVRSLAQKSAESSKEIRQLIGASSAQIATSVQRIQAAGVTISEVVEGIRDLSDSMLQIATSSTEQSSGLSGITQAAHQLDEITQHNAQMVVRTVHKAENMERRANSLVHSVAIFKLQQGSPEEAIGLVQKAAAFRTRTSPDNFLRALSDPGQGFCDRDMYVFVLDDDGTYRAFGGNQSKVGTRVQDIAGVDGQSLLAAILEQARIEPGWVEYQITNPTTGAVQTKMSYVQEMDGLYLGCGVYMNLVGS